ncbi:MAG: hypothetical protein H6701_11385 [Myxococcales bacterium]|nr:hypothetical protein [Myxococcales bacterium]
MQHAALADRFNAASRGLEAKGHRVVVRRARALLEAGDAAGAIDFLEDAGSRMVDAELEGLADALRAWQREGGDARALVTVPAWVEGVAHEQRLGRFLAHATANADLGALAARLAEQQAGLASGAPLPAEPPAQVAPDQLPPLPGKDVERPGAAIANIFPDARRPRAAVEAPSDLTERPLDLDGTPAAEVAPAAVSAPPPAVAASAPPPAIEPSAPPPAIEPSAPPAPMAGPSLASLDEATADPFGAPAAPAAEPPPAAPAAEPPPPPRPRRTRSRAPVSRTCPSCTRRPRCPSPRRRRRARRARCTRSSGWWWPRRPRRPGSSSASEPRRARRQPRMRLRSASRPAGRAAPPTAAR